MERAFIVWRNAVALAIPLINIAGRMVYDILQAMEVQTLIFGKDKFTADQAKAWAEEHGFKSDKVDDEENVIRLRQFEPELCEMNSFKTWELEGGVQAGGCKKKGASPAPAEDAAGDRDKKTLELPVYIKSLEGNRVGGLASHRSLDRHNEVVLPSAFTNTIEKFMKSPIMLLGHESDAAIRLSIGKFHKLALTEDGLEVLGELFDDIEDFKAIRRRVAENLMMWSIGFLVTANGRRKATKEEKDLYGEDTDTVVEELELLEISLVNIGANRLTFALLKELALTAGRRDLKDANASETTRLLKEVRDSAQRALKGSRAKAGDRKDVAEQVEAIRALANDFMMALNPMLDEIAGTEEPVGDEPPSEEPPPPPPEEPVEEALSAEDRKALINLKDTAVALVRRSQNQEAR